MARETTTEMEAAKGKHKADMTKLLLQKEALVDRAKAQRKEHKVAMATAVGKQDALSIQCSAVECTNQKLVRNLNAERVKGEGLLARTSSLELQVSELSEVHVACVAAEKEAATANKAKVSLTKAVEQGRNRLKAAKVVLHQKHKDTVKAFEDGMLKWKEKEHAMSVEMAGLQKDIRDARTVSECTTSIVALFYSKISFAFPLPFTFHR
jgi:hypothetical protein